MEILGIVAAFLLGLIIGKIKLDKFKNRIDNEFSDALNVIEKGLVDKYRKDN